MEKNIFLQNILNELMSNPLGGEINSDASRVVQVGNVQECEIHCWDGRRFRLTLETLPKGGAYDPKTGKPIT